MLPNIRTGIIIVSLGLLPGLDLTAQVQVSAFADIGQNNVSDGLFVKSAVLAYYQFGKNRVEAGLQFDLIDYHANALSGMSLKAERQFSIKDKPLEIQGFFLRTPFSDVLQETNWGVLLGMEQGHFILKIGTGFRTYSYTQSTAEYYGFDESSRIRENWNLLYSFSYQVKSPDNPWNIGLSVTNIDHFIISQETNPVVGLRGQYKPGQHVNLFGEGWYQNAGAFNLSVNYFGFFFRTGIAWDIH